MHLKLKDLLSEETIGQSDPEIYKVPSDPSQEYIAAAAIKMKNGDIALGTCHANARENYARAMTVEEGFMTSKNKFLTRKQGTDFIRSNRQLKNPPAANVNLDSGDFATK